MNTQELKNILLVEDDPDIRLIGSMALASAGFNVNEAASAVEALQTVKQLNPQMIVMDVMMPEIDGPTALIKLKSDPATQSIPFIFMTAKAQPHEIKKFLELGAIEVITKPFDPIALPDQILAAWNKHHDKLRTSNI